MRWQNKVKGERRIKTKFLLFPLTISRETRWLEYATMEEKYCDYALRKWIPIKFIDEDTKTS